MTGQLVINPLHCELMAFEIGNDLGRKARLVSDAIRRSIVQDDGVRLRNGVERLMDAFNDGEPWALGMVMDRLEGKAAQAISVESADGLASFTSIQLVVVQPIALPVNDLQAIKHDAALQQTP